MKRNLRLPGLMILAAALMMVGSAMAGNNSDAWLGVYSQTVDEDLKEAFDLDYESGAIIKHVISDSPADEAGLKQGDIIIKIDDNPVASSDDLAEIVKKQDPGKKIDILIVRNGKEKTLEATLASADMMNTNPGGNFKWYAAPNAKSKSYVFKEFEGSDTYIGISLESLTDQLGEYFGVDDGNGILITEVFEDSPAEKAGLKAGDVITKVDGDAITDVSDIQKVIRNKDKGEKVELTLIRNKKAQDITVEVAEAPEGFAPDAFGNIPNFDQFHMFMPQMKGMYHGNWGDDSFDAQQQQDDMEAMRQQMKELQKELKEIKEKLD